MSLIGRGGEQELSRVGGVGGRNYKRNRDSHSAAAHFRRSFFEVRFEGFQMNRGTPERTRILRSSFKCSDWTLAHPGFGGIILVEIWLLRQLCPSPKHAIITKDPPNVVGMTLCITGKVLV